MCMSILFRIRFFFIEKNIYMKKKKKLNREGTTVTFVFLGRAVNYLATLADTCHTHVLSHDIRVLRIRSVTAETGHFLSLLV